MRYSLMQQESNPASDEYGEYHRYALFPSGKRPLTDDRLPIDQRTITVTAVLSDVNACLLYTSPSPRDGLLSRMPSSA